MVCTSNVGRCFALMLAMNTVANPETHAMKVDAPRTNERRSESLSPAAHVLFDEFRGRITEAITEHAIPGMAVAVLDGKQMWWQAGFGVTDRPTGRSVTPETLFSVQSISKNFTAVTAMLEVQRGRLNLGKRPVTTVSIDR